MKSWIYTALAVHAIGWMPAFSQEALYTFSVYAEEYIRLDTPTPLHLQPFVADTSFPLPLRHPLTVGEDNYDSAVVTTSGQVFLYNTTTQRALIVSPFGASMRSYLGAPETSAISYGYRTEANGDSVLIVEWRSMFFQVMDGLFDSIHMQVHFDYQRGEVSFVYGPAQTELVYVAFRDLDSGKFGGYVGIGTREDSLYKGWWLVGDSSAPEMVEVLHIYDSIGHYRLGFPPAGTRFHWHRVLTTRRHNPHLHLTPCRIQLSSHRTIEEASDFTFDFWAVYDLTGRLRYQTKEPPFIYAWIKRWRQPVVLIGYARGTPRCKSILHLLPAR